VSDTARRKPRQGTSARATGVAAASRRAQSRQSHLAALAALLTAAEPLLPAPDTLEVAPLAESATASGLVELARSVLGAEQSGLIAIDPETGALLPLAIVGVAPEMATLWRASVSGGRLADYLTAAHIADLRAGQTLIFNWTRSPLNACLFFGMPTALIAPLRVGDQLTGLLGLNLGGARPYQPTADAIALARSVAAFAALALDREHLLRERLIGRSSAGALREDQDSMKHSLEHTAHEIKNPVAVISANTDWVDQQLQRLESAAPAAAGPLPPKSIAQMRTMLRHVKERAALLDRLARDLEDAARLEADRLEPHEAPCDLRAIVRTVVEDQRQVAPARTITLDAPDGAPISLIADAARIGQVLTNYLSNAIKYSPAERPIAVTVRAEGDCARVAVRDHGPGLPPAEHDRVWGRLYRSAGVERQPGSTDGLGLGLYLSRAIIERHGGQVGVTSRPGHGCTFWFTLPLPRPAS
jgi:signal transduction histidine kinase